MPRDAVVTALDTRESFYIWQIPGADSVIHLSLGVVERLNAIILQSLSTKSERSSEIGGILLGNVEADDGTVVVEDFLLIACEHWRGASWTLSPKDRIKLGERLSRRQWPAPLTVVGCFRTHTRLGLYLDQDDFNLFSQYFSEAHQVFLLMRPTPGSASTAGFFVWEDGDVHRQSTRLAFPFDAAQLRTREHAVVERSPSAPRLCAEPRAALPVPLPLPTGWRLPAAGAAVLLAAAALYQWVAPRFANGPRSEPQALTLRVERTGAALRLLWDRESPVIRKARSGIVNISEGPRRLRIDLTAQQLASGSVTYFPSTPDVAFDVELRGPGVSVNESVRAVVPAAELPPPALPLEARTFEPPTPEAPEPADVAPSGTAHRSARRAPAHRPFQFALSTPAPVASAIEPPPRLAATAHSAAAPGFLAPRLRRVTVTCKPAAPSRFSRVIGHIPLVRSLQGSRRGKDYVPPEPLRQIKPVVPASLSLDEGKEPVELKVHIDEAGRVERTELVSDASAAANLATRAAAEWRFSPARVNGKPVSSEMLLQFKFEP